ncbi:Uncharacterized SAM-binding protein YcdF, DUF218 family [Meinhardsimonia xiamenensis]|uniref:Uncharacterized SAM-binding protein YcdF, DUF218 family n=1 Tax=Meinhardsimonia xiamenensis TaxID=990712 RepID=A0A1G8Z9L0_9RHOB|nr:YdcF family protein [Meinhardsimonia xiamenensis]PRX37611.1 uncharacterized SAM-binding protein YcdF (DUF218 family) [Meinhardsimonia xiamenensis]SDK11759.1 Uncharacterized SAM-binding protein YcdF, DUF218 family [Meinhardsimonia xiamenensis]
MGGGTIFFVASKVLGLLARPETWLFLALVIALRRLAQGRVGAARRWLGGAALAVLLLGAWPVGDLVLGPLEARYPPRPALSRVDGIIVLSGAEEAELSRLWGMPELNGAGERLFAGLALARQFPDARVVVTGGSGRLGGARSTEAEVAAAVLTDAGLERSRLVLETRSRNTWENAIFSRPLAKPRPGETWVLVTSAWHMPRAMGVFCAAGWPVVPYPVDQRSGMLGLRPEWELWEHGDALRRGVKEWVGLLAYGLSGRTAECGVPPG